MLSLALIASVAFGQVLQPDTPELMEVEQDSDCPTGTTLVKGNTLPTGLPDNQFYTNNVATSKITCSSTALSNCGWCVPNGIVDTSKGATSFVITPRCANAVKQSTSAGYYGVGSLSYTYGAYPEWATSWTASAGYHGYARYQLCDNGGRYSQVVVPIGNPATAPQFQPIPSLHCIPDLVVTSCSGSFTCESDGLGMHGVDYPCFNFPDTLPAGCTIQQPALLKGIVSQENCCPYMKCPPPPVTTSCTNKASAQNALPSNAPSFVQNPFTKAPRVSCAGGVNTSPCPICAPSSPVNSGGTYNIYVNGTGDCAVTSSASAWAGAGSINVVVTSSGMGIQFVPTRTTASTDYGWVKYEFCDAKGLGGSWVVFF